MSTCGECGRPRRRTWWIQLLPWAVIALLGGIGAVGKC